MEKYILNNGVKLIYEHREGSLTSFCIGFEAGANMEESFPLGTAHAVEHMLFKGTLHRTEFEINSLSDEIFAFNNAMTNYPYSIYYGTTLSSQLERGLELYTDILRNPLFAEEGFTEEMNIICEELKEWQDDLAQYCEDMLLKNAFNSRRTKERIIGNEESIKAITLEILIKFYKKFYCPKNCVVAVTSSLDFETVLKIVEDKLSSWENEYSCSSSLTYESNNKGIYYETKAGISGAKLQYIFPIDDLNDREIAALRLFNLCFGEGTSSLLYDELRTKHGLVYDIRSLIKNEKGIKLFTIVLATSQSNIETAVELINKVILKVKTEKELFNNKQIEKYANIIKLKKEFMAERAVEHCKNLTTYEIMYGGCEKLQEEIKLLGSISGQEITEVINKTLVEPSIQIIRPHIS